MAKVSSKLPEFLQNPKLKNFFDGTVEQAFSKADNEKVTEWIGRKYGTYYNPFKDSYKEESNNLRQNYQLETTALISKENYNEFRIRCIMLILGKLIS